MWFQPSLSQTTSRKRREVKPVATLYAGFNMNNVSKSFHVLAVDFPTGKIPGAEWGMGEKAQAHMYKEPGQPTFSWLLPQLVPAEGTARVPRISSGGTP